MEAINNSFIFILAARECHVKDFMMMNKIPAYAIQSNNRQVIRYVSGYRDLQGIPRNTRYCILDTWWHDTREPEKKDIQVVLKYRNDIKLNEIDAVEWILHKLHELNGIIK